MPEHIEQSDDFTKTQSGVWFATTQGAQCRATVPPSVSGPFALLVEMTGATAGATPLFTVLWDGVPPARGNTFFMSSAGGSVSLSVTIDPADPDLGPGTRTLYVNVRRQAGDGSYQDELFLRIPVTVSEPNPRLRPLYSNVPAPGAAPVTLGTLTKPISSGAGGRESPALIQALPGSGPVQYGARVFATPSALTALPHLDKRGGVRTTYDAANSIFVLVMVDARPDELVGNPSLGPALLAAGVNTIMTGFFERPQDVAAFGTAAAAAAHTIAYGNALLQPCVDGGFAVLGSTDEWDRDPVDQKLVDGTTTHPSWPFADWGGPVLDNAMSHGVCVAWGPDEADDVFSAYGPGYGSRAVLHALTAARGLPMALPGKSEDALEASGFCDVLGRYYDNRESAYAGPRGLYVGGQWLQWMRARLDGYLTKAPAAAKPLVVLIQCDYGAYDKRSAGADPNPAAGDTWRITTPAYYVTMQAGFALTRGACGFFYYGAESAWARTLRQGYPIPTPAAEYRPDPLRTTTVANGHMDAVSVVNNAVKLWGARLLSPPASALNRGPGFECCARDGGAGKKLWMAVNCTDAARVGVGGAPAGSWTDGWIVSETGRVRVDPASLASQTVNPGNWIVLTD